MEAQAASRPRTAREMARIRRDRRIILVVNLVPLLAVVLVGCDQLRASPLLGRPGWFEFSLFGISHLLGMVGLEVGYHRYFAHRSFKAGRGLTLLLGILGSMSFQGGVVWWVATHRRHHSHTDREGDPHSPHAGFAPGFLGRLRGFFHAHVGWMFDPRCLKPPQWEAWAQDMFRDPLLLALHLNYWKWGLLGLALPALLGGLWHMTWEGALSGLAWGGLLRVFSCNQLMYATNSVCHSFGSRMFPRADGSRNVLLLAPVSIGLSLHNNHHAVPANARLDFRWWQPDPGGWLILALAKIKLVSHLNLASQEQIALKQLARPREAEQKDFT
ncbi:MAG: acyl-CoA desaturase [Paucimonas sp.]|nr:acyl-CoA desaturase [Paucimonas sp.]